MKYKPMHRYELVPASATKPITKPSSVEGPISTGTKADRLRELKELLDEGILTQEEFDQQKDKVLNEK